MVPAGRPEMGGKVPSMVGKGEKGEEVADKRLGGHGWIRGKWGDGVIEKLPGQRVMDRCLETGTLVTELEGVSCLR